MLSNLILQPCIEASAGMEICKLRLKRNPEGDPPSRRCNVAAVLHGPQPFQLITYSCPLPAGRRLFIGATPPHIIPFSSRSPSRVEAGCRENPHPCHYSPISLFHIIAQLFSAIVLWYSRKMTRCQQEASPFSSPAHRTGRADLPHPVLGLDSPQAFERLAERSLSRRTSPYLPYRLS